MLSVAGWRPSYALTLAVVVVTASFAATSPATADPGDVGVSAQSGMKGETFARADNLRKAEFWNETVQGVDGVASSSYRWSPNASPAPFSPVLEDFTCPADGCASFDGRSHGSVDAAKGKLKAYASADMLIGNPPRDGYGLAGYVSNTGEATLDDSITLSQPARVVLEGRVRGHFDAYNSHPDWYSDPRASVEVNARFSRDRRAEEFHHGEEASWVDLDGFTKSYEPTVRGGCGNRPCDAPAPEVPTGTPGTAVDEPFSVEIELPAGKSYFNASLLASADVDVGVAPDEIVSKSSLLDFADTLDFQVRIPAGVTATSGSGRLPLVGGDPAPAQDSTAPSATHSVSPEPNETGWNKEDATVELRATDEDGGSGIKDITYSAAGVQPIDSATVAGAAASIPITQGGETTITYSARDNAGNVSEPRSVTVKVDTTDPRPTVISPQEGHRYEQGEDVRAAYSCADEAGGSGLVACQGDAPDGQPIDTSALGTRSFAVTARDAAGNEGGKTVTYEVVEPPDETAPVLDLPSAIARDATSPRGASVNYHASASDDRDGAVPVTCEPESGSLFAIGETTVRCWTRDRADNVSRGTFTVTVRGPGPQLDRLAGAVRRLDMPRPFERMLLRPLKDATREVARDETRDACRDVRRFEATVLLVARLRGSRANILRRSEAEELLLAAERIRATLGCRRWPLPLGVLGPSTRGA